MRINTNVEALNAHRNLSQTNNNMQKNLERLSSGQRINRAADDAAGLSISEKMRGQVSGLNQAVSNAQDSISMIQTAEGALEESHNILQRMRELAVQSANDTNIDDDRGAIQDEMDQLAEELGRISETTEFNTQELVDGSFEGTFHIGANEGQNIDLEIGDMSADALGVAGDGGASFTTSIEEDIRDIDEEALGLEEGEQELNVVEIDNVTTADGEVTANYGLENEDGDIVAVSQNGSEYEFLEEATDVDNISQAEIVGTSDDAGIEFDDPVTSGTVSMDADSDFENVDFEGTARVDMENGLDSGEYTVIEEDFGDHFDFPDVDEDSAFDTIEQGLINEDGDLVAVSFNNDDIDGTTPFSDAPEGFFNVEDIDWEVDSDLDNGTAGDLDAAIEDADPIFDMNTELEADEVIEIRGDGGIDVSTQDSADSAISDIDEALDTVSEQRSELGALQNRLEHTINNLSVASENLEAAESRIRDVDMAEEMMDFSTQQVLEEAGTAMMAQANMQPQSVLQLLQ
ncbi:flagellin [Natranaerobius trueperi]|uniref:Flagellin n=1 Tax=Natranaerobius trueperi TaxID=759412 RepID=A0A226C317_9FIRM|nr:flagellin [Natranaerobius trueperi]OWZ84849.1 flagellin [Natranaerobius trueperi]